MKGMELAHEFFELYGKPMMAEFSSYSSYMAAGLVGEGSQCYGYDDYVSQDHDFGTGFCIWLPQRIYDAVGKAMEKKYRELPKNFGGIDSLETEEGRCRVGIFSIEDFYQRYTGCRPVPTDNREWFFIPERFLSIATNGRVFLDNSGEFSGARRLLLEFYPVDVLRKKLATRAAVMAQAGQYNYVRSIKRGDYGAAYLACGRFIEAGLSAIFLLNREYMPFYKWSLRKAGELPKLRDAVKNLKRLTAVVDGGNTGKQKEAMIEAVCVDVARELNAQGFSSKKEDFLQNHCGEIMEGIVDERLRKLHVMADND